jgi:tetratricopeptide (TPR) repeat protein
MNIFQIEERIKEEPTSPLSVRLAGLYVARGRIDEAIKLCLATLQRDPNYATAYTILGRCYAANKRYQAAVDCLEKSILLLPDAELPQRLLNNWHQIIGNVSTTESTASFENESPSIPVVFEAATIDNEASSKPIEFSKETIEPPSFEIIEPESIEQKPKIETQVLFQETLEVTPPNEESILIPPTIEATAEISVVESFPSMEQTETISTGTTELETKISGLSAPEPVVNTEAPFTIVDFETKNDLLTDDNGPPIISLTLADIYTKQGEFNEAINIYKALIKRRPKEREFFENKIKELEVKSHLQ